MKASLSEIRSSSLKRKEITYIFQHAKGERRKSVFVVRLTHYCNIQDLTVFGVLARFRISFLPVSTTF